MTQTRAEHIDQLLAILAKHVAEMRSYVRWEGCEFAKAIVGNSILGALRDLGCDEERIAEVMQAR